MKNNNFGRYFLSIAFCALVILMAVDAFAIGLTSLSHTRNTDNLDNRAGTYSNKNMVVAPYWQVDSGSYTFVAVTHSSLSGMASQIGVTINAITSSGAAYATAPSFTILAGATKRVFIVPTNHTTINPTSITTAAFLSGTSDYTYGHIRANSVASHPHLKYYGDGGYNNANQIDVGAGFRDITTLSYWGSVIIEANTTGFAMEFIGDMNDSQGTYTLESADYMSSGVNLQ